MKLVKLGEFEERLLKAPLQVVINVVVGFKSGTGDATFALVSGEAQVDPQHGHITYRGGKQRVEFHFHLVKDHWDGTLAFEESNNWPLIAGYKKMFGDLPKDHSHVEFGVPERRRDDHMLVLYKPVDVNRALAYNLKFIATHGNARLHEVFNLDPRIINRPK